MRRLMMLLCLLAALALACSAGDDSGQQNTAGTPAPGGAVTLTPVFLPQIDTGGGSTPAPAAPAPGAAPNTVYLPDIAAGSAGQDAGQNAAPGTNPQVLLEVSAISLRVGETLTVTGRPSGIGMPYYIVMVQDAGAAEAQPLGQVTYENQPQPQPGASQVFELVSAEGGMDVVTFVLRAKVAGSAAVNINATGEVQGESGAYTWSGGGSQPITITVSE